MVSAPDGCRSLFSYGEVFLDPAGERMIIAERINNKPLIEGGKFLLAAPDDLMADRWVKAVEAVDVISLQEKAKPLSSLSTRRATQEVNAS